MIESPGVPMREIVADPLLCPRADMGEQRVRDHVQEMTDDLKFGTDLRPVVLFRDGPRRYWLASGYCTFEAYEAKGRRLIPATIHLGDYQAALAFSLRANAEWKALKRTQADRRRAVTKALDVPEWKRLPGREIARMCGVSEFLVRAVRTERRENQIEDEEGGDCDLSQSGLSRSQLTDLARALKQLGQSPAKMVRQLIVAGVPESEWRPPIEQLIGLIRHYGGAAATEHLEKLERTIASFTEEPAAAS